MMIICRKDKKKMNNEVTFNIKILMNGQEKLVQATSNSKELGSAIDAVSSNSRKLNDELLNTNQRVAAYQNFFAGMQQIVDVTKQMTDTYGNAEVANTKLITVMRQRMGAQSDDVSSVRALISAQTDLGVISGTVQTSGAQQMATFLSQKSSLETLIPAMNNLIAQQDGLNATQESAASIGNMMGKAMQGQTTVLQRVGITFSDAQAKVLKYGTEEQRAATLAQVIKDNVGEMNVALGKTDAGKAKQTAMWFDALKVKIGGAVSAIQPFLTAFNQIGMTMFALIQVKNGFVAITGAISLSTIATKAHSVATGICTGMQNMHKAAMIQLTAATGSATVAATALAAAYTMGLSIAITGLITLVSNLCDGEDDASKKTEDMSAAAEEAKSKHQEESQALASARVEIETMISKLKEFHGTKSQEKKLIDDCNQKYGDAMGYYGSVADWYKVLVTNSALYCDQMVNEARIRNLANQAAEADQKVHDLKTGKTRKRTKDEEEIASTFGPNAAGSGPNAASAQQEYNQALQESISAKKQMNGLLKEQGQLADKMSKSVPGTRQYKNPPSPGGGNGRGGKTGNGGDKDDSNILIKNAESYAALGHNIEVYQKRIDGAKPSEKEQIKAWTEQIVKAKKAQDAIRALQGEYAKPAELKSAQDYDTEIQRQEGLLRTAGAEERKSINATIDDLKKKKQSMEASSRAEPVMEEIKSYDELNDAINYYQDALNSADATARTSISRQLKELRELKEKWEEADTASDAPQGIEKLKTFRELDNAIQYYTKKAETSEGDQLTAVEVTIGALQRKRQLLTDIGNLSQGAADIGDLKALTGKELTIRLKEIGIDGIKKKISDLNKLLASPQATDAQKKNIKNQINEWTAYDNKLRKSEVSVRGTWDTVKGLGNGIDSLSKALKGGGSAWKKMTGIVDAGIDIFNGVMSVIQIVKALTAATTAEQAGEAGTQMATNSAEAATWTGLAAAKTAAAYAGIPFIGEGLATAQVAAIKAMVTAAAIPTFANGGIAYGPTLGIFGEYAGASNNPEIVAPLDRLKQLIAPAGSDGGSGKVRFEIEGRKLVGILDRENNRRQRT